MKTRLYFIEPSKKERMHNNVYKNNDIKDEWVKGEKVVEAFGYYYK